MNFLMNSKLAFQPPSDMGTTGGGKSSIWKFVGMGCGVLLLITGLILAFGGYKMFTCCDGMKGVVVRAQEGQVFASNFADTISKQDFDAAYLQTSPRYQEHVTKEEFNAMFAKYEDVLKTPPTLQNFNVNQTNMKANPGLEDLNRYRVSFIFPQSGINKAPLLEFTVTAQEEEHSFLVDDVKINVVERSFSREQPGRQVLAFHKRINEGRSPLVYQTLTEGFRSKTTPEAFNKFLEDVGPILTSSTMEVVSVEYGTPTSATVITRAQTSDGKKGLIQFELVLSKNLGVQMWKIAAIAPLLAADQPADAKLKKEVNHDGDGKTIDAPQKKIIEAPKNKTNL